MILPEVLSGATPGGRPARLSPPVAGRCARRRRSILSRVLRTRLQGRTQETDNYRQEKQLCLQRSEGR